MKVENLLAEKLHLPPVNALKAFDAAGRHLNFRAAAEELGVSQGAVAQQVRGLEAHLGLKLFERHSKGLAFTAEGRGYHQQVSAAFAMLQEATLRLAPTPSKVTISVTPTFAAKWLIPNLQNLTALHQEIDLRVLATDSVLSFHGDGIDLAIRQGSPPFGAAIDARLLFHSDIVAIAAPALVQGRDLPLPAHAFGELPLLQDMHDLWPAFLREVLGVRDWAGKKRLSFSQTSLSIDAALAGQGIALASRFLVEQDFLAGRLVEVAGGSFNGGRDFHLLAQKSAARSPAVSAVMEWLLGKSEMQS